MVIVSSATLDITIRIFFIGFPYPSVAGLEIVEILP